MIVMGSAVFAGLLYQAIKNPHLETVLPVIGSFVLLGLVILFRYLK